MKTRFITASMLAFSLGIFSNSLAAQTVLSGNHSVDGHLCAGQECTGSESFSGLPELTLKSALVNLRFIDTSTGAGFPTRDWELQINGGNSDSFSIVDLGTNNKVFNVAADAPSNALYINNEGKIGVGTSLPVQELHVVDGVTPTLRLELDNSGGFTPQTWDLFGNDAGIGFSDKTNSRIPFMVEPGGASFSLIVADDGNVGLGTRFPDDALHVIRNDGTAALRVEDTGNSNGNLTMLHLVNESGRARMQFSSTGSAGQTGDWSISSGNTFVLQDRSDSQNVLIVDQDGNVAITGELTTTGSCSVGCDRVFDADYKMLSLEQHTDAMWSNGYLPNVGPTPEDGMFNVSDKMGRMLNELEHAHIYIGQLHDRLAVQETLNDRLLLRLEKLEAVMVR